MLIGEKLSFWHKTCCHYRDGEPGSDLSYIIYHVYHDLCTLFHILEAQVDRTYYRRGINSVVEIKNSCCVTVRHVRYAINPNEDSNGCCQYVDDGRGNGVRNNNALHSYTCERPG